MRKGIICGCNESFRKWNLSEVMEECKGLAEACEIEIVDELVQNLEHMDRNTCLGSGKIMELKQRVDDHEADCVVFFHDLSAGQVQAITDILDCEVIDRTTVILDLFSRRARTKEAQLQVEMARLNYLLPKLSQRDLGSDQQRGGSGVKNKGKGEGRLQLQQRGIKKKISVVKKELEQLAKEQKLRSEKRMNSSLKRVALVGYTNAGKSSLMNALLGRQNASEDKKVFEKDMLFATLDTSTRKIDLPSGKSFLLSDTVGFVSSLPHSLVQAFHSTLNAAKEADLLIQVVDSSSDLRESHMEITQNTLREIGAGDVEILTIMNKCDLIQESDNRYLCVSTRDKTGIDELLNEIECRLFERSVTMSGIIPYSKLGIVQTLRQNADVKELEHMDEGVLIEVSGSPEMISLFEKHKLAD